MSTPILPTDNGDPFLDGLAHLGWVRATHGEYLHEDGSTIVCQTGTRRGTTVQVRVFTLTYGNGQRGGVALDLASVVNHHRRETASAA